MKAKVALQREDIWKAIEEVASTGHAPTYKLIIQRLGRGSNSQIGPVLREWQTENRPAPSTTNVPSSVSAAGIELIEQVWRIAAECQQMDLVAERRRMDEQAKLNESAIETIEAENAVLVEQLDRQQALYDQVNVQYQELQNRLAELSETHNSSKLEVARLTSALAIASENLLDARSKVDDAQAISRVAKEESKALQLEATRLQSGLDMSTEQRVELQRQLAESNAIVGQLQSENTSSKAELLDAKDHLLAQATQLDATQEALRSCQRNCIELEHKVLMLQSQLAGMNEVKNECNTLRLQLQNSGLAEQQLVMKVDNLERDLIELSEQNDAAKSNSTKAQDELRAAKVVIIQQEAKLQTMNEMLSILGGRLIEQSQR
ncbi:DNA-binding protein (plasmid) [Aeromonas caviae]|nr:DNA-binding protein [Aeromonas caviae]